MATGVAVAYDFFIGTVTNIIAAAVLDSKAPSLLDDCDKDKPKKDEGKSMYQLFSFVMIKSKTRLNMLFSPTLPE